MSDILSGKEVAKFNRIAIKKEITSLFEKYGRKPGLVCILVGEDPASQVYVGSKERTSQKLGLLSEILRLPEKTSEKELLDHVERFNKDDKFDGILVQLPLPKHINETKVINAISPEKDVDVFHPQNIGRLWNGTGNLASCTPLGVMKILEYYKIPLEGKDAVIIGRSNIVGKPMAALLLRENATVTICHSRTKDLDKVCKKADVLIAAIGRANFVTKDFVKPGAVLIDVGMNRLDDGKLAGDIDFENVKEISSAITPVPGGVGPMTIAMLMLNTVNLFKEHQKNA